MTRVAMFAIAGAMLLSSVPSSAHGATACSREGTDFGPSAGPSSEHGAVADRCHFTAGPGPHFFVGAYIDGYRICVDGNHDHTCGDGADTELASGTGVYTTGTPDLPMVGVMLDLQEGQHVTVEMLWGCTGVPPGAGGCGAFGKYYVQ